MTPELLVAAVKALSSQAPALRQGNPDAGLLPDVTEVRAVSARIAAAVIKQAVNDGLAQEDVPENDEDLETWIREQMWRAEYRPFKKVT